ncbi:MAG: hypothetical protein AB8B78_07280 [Polaribacter sp.]
MRTTISKKNFLKSSTLFYSLSVLILSALLFTSCSESELSDASVDDTSLITEIESASKITVAVSSLPSATKSALNGDLADSFVQNVQLATGLGYKVTLITDNESRAEVNSDIFFSAAGKLLEDKSAKRKKRRNKCFQFVFPIDFIMPDNSSITLNEKADWVLIREWYTANPTATERPELIFPVNITLEDGTEQTLIDRDELKTIKDSCKRTKDKRKCFKLDLPVTFTMPDATDITVNDRSEFKLVRRWHKANPTVKEKGVLNFPVNITYKDGTTGTVNDADELKAAKESCKN